MGSVREVKARDFKFGVVYNYGSDLNPSLNFTVQKIEDNILYLSDCDFIEDYIYEEYAYYFVRELTDLTKALL